MARTPTTIAELLQMAQELNMPLQKMRFFIGVDCREPRCFGIYRDGNDVVVYKNKDTGERAVRYRGPDEAEAVAIIYQKMDEEILLRRHLRGDTTNYAYKAQMDAAKQAGSPRPPKKPRMSMKQLGAILFVVVALGTLGVRYLQKASTRNGYYHRGSSVYYLLDNDWYIWNDAYSSWAPYNAGVDFINEAEYDRDYYGGSDYGNWQDFRDTSYYDTWQDSQESSFSSWDNDWSSSDWGDWDFGSTDWSSDW